LIWRMVSGEALAYPLAMSDPLRRLLRVSRRTHRVLGLALALYLVLMAFSGVLLNHPEVIAGVDLPRAWLPGDYEYRNWNRQALRGSVRAPGGEEYLHGEAGVWLLQPGPGEPEALDVGFERSAYYRDTRTLLRLDGSPSHLLAGTRGGLYLLGPSGRWEPVPLPGAGKRPHVVDLLEADGRVLALTRDRLYHADPTSPGAFSEVTLPRAPEPERGLPLFRLVFHLHSGALWGPAGRLFVDLSGLLLVFCAVTGTWFWWRRRRGSLARGRVGKLVRRGLSWHIRLGLWSAPLLLFVALTGFFQRPPFLIAIANAAYPPRLHPAPEERNPWQDLLRKALWDERRGTLVLSTADGFHEGSLSGSEPFRRLEGGPPVSVMGATVFRSGPAGEYWVGSMSGLFRWERATGRVLDAFSGLPPKSGSYGPVGEQKIMGLVPRAGGGLLALEYDLGLIGPEGAVAAIPMPVGLRDGGRISLWHALFELHNGRLFGFLLGWWSWILVPLGGLALCAEVASGVADRWISRSGKAHTPRRARRGADQQPRPRPPSCETERSRSGERSEAAPET
jgi:uncharacterized iron-regulated membrane protein